MNQTQPTTYRPSLAEIAPRNLPTVHGEHTYVHTRATSKHRTKGRRLRSDDLLTRKRSKLRVIELLKPLPGLEAQRVRERLEVCGSKFSLVSCGKHITQVQNHSRCEHRLCPFCAARRAKKFSTDYLPKIGLFLRHAPVPVTPCLLTLTQTHKHGESLSDARKRLYTAFKKLIRREVWHDHFLGGLWAFEAVLGTDGLWHAHLHILVFRKRFVSDLESLKTAWHEVTGDSHVLNLKRIDDIREGMKEVVKYMNKPADFDRMTSEHIRQLLALRDQRLFGTFGKFAEFCKTVEIEDETRREWLGDECETYVNGDPCPTCGDPLFQITGTLDEITDFCFRIEASNRGRPG